jgi:hypothetical protein
VTILRISHFGRKVFGQIFIPRWNFIQEISGKVDNFL